jgi:glycogen synthase
MADTVFDQDHSRRLSADRNGYAFYHTDNQALESALSRALWLWSARSEEFGQLAANCMRADYSWVRPAQEYLDISQHIRHKRHVPERSRHRNTFSLVAQLVAAALWRCAWRAGRPAA